MIKTTRVTFIRYFVEIIEEDLTTAKENATAYQGNLLDYLTDCGFDDTDEVAITEYTDFVKSHQN